METVQRVLKGHPGLVHVTIGQVGAAALGAVFWFVLAGLLDPGDYGQTNWLISVAMFASTFCVLGWGRTNHTEGDFDHGWATVTVAVPVPQFGGWDEEFFKRFNEMCHHRSLDKIVFVDCPRCHTKARVTAVLRLPQGGNLKR